MRHIRIDPHAHLYDSYSLDVWSSSVVDNLQVNDTVAGAVVLVDREGQDSFARLRRELDRSRWIEGQATSSGTSRNSLIGQCTVDQRSFFVIRGVQYVSAERIEVLGLGVARGCSDGERAVDLLRRIREEGGVACLPWSPGKWLGARGQVVRSLLRSDIANDIVFGDISIRSSWGPPSLLLREARRTGHAVVCGTDPLPRPDDARLAGSYGVQAELPSVPEFENVRETCLAVISSKSKRLARFGRPNGVFCAVRRFISTL